MTKEQLLLIARDSKLVYGALGDQEKCNAYEESLTLDGEHGYLTKYFGIKTPYKGWIEPGRIDRTHITKRAFLEASRALWWRPKRLVRVLISIYKVEGGIWEWRLGDNEFCPALRELIRVSDKVIKGETAELSRCLAMFLYFSPTYRMWLQDIAGEINKESFLKSPLKETIRLIRIFLKRWKSGNPERLKVKTMLWALLIVIILKRKLAKEFAAELNPDRVKLDDMDWYYCLRRGNYDFKGLTLEERLKLVEKRDKEEENIILGI